jgi:hypothetical protein
MTTMPESTTPEPTSELGPLDGAPGPAPIISARREDALVKAALDRRFGRERAAPRLLRVAAVVLISFVAVGAAAAITYLVVRPRQPQVEQPAPAPTRQRRRSPERQPAVTPPTPLADAAEQPAPLPKRAKTRGAQDLLAEANRLRAGRRWRAAERRYRDVIRRFPGTDQAYAATVSAAILRQRQLGDPRGALRLYRATLADRQRSYLRQEAMFGVAECHRALGHRAAEIQALRAYLAAFPAGPMNARARQRLEQLSGAR